MNWFSSFFRINEWKEIYSLMRFVSKGAIVFFILIQWVVLLVVVRRNPWKLPMNKRVFSMKIISPVEWIYLCILKRSIHRLYSTNNSQWDNLVNQKKRRDWTKLCLLHEHLWIVRSLWVVVFLFCMYNQQSNHWRRKKCSDSNWILIDDNGFRL